MATERSGNKAAVIGEGWASLTWDDLHVWAGARSVSRGRTYQRQGKVGGLAVAEDGRLLATVRGRQTYTVLVWMTNQKGIPLASKCTCPVGYNGCKHAVAVVAEHLEQLSQGRAAPVAEADDPRWEALNGGGAADDDAGIDDADMDMDEDEPDESPVARRRLPARQSRADQDKKIKEHIFAKSRKELAEMVWSLTGRFPDLREELAERIALAEGDIDRLVAEAREELRQVTSEEAWSNRWNDEGNIPDYDKLLRRLTTLLEQGHADAVAGLGQELIGRGMKQVEQSHDGGETADALAGCMAVVFEAVAKSSWTPVQKLLFAIDAVLMDDYDIINDKAEVVLGGKYAPAVWSEVADSLAGRLSPRGARAGKSNSADEVTPFSRNYERDQISGWLALALERANRGDDVLAIYEKEARATGSYVRLVEFLIGRKQYDEAVGWAAEGIEKTASSLAGIASQLADHLCKIAQSRRQWDVVAAHAAQVFFERPSGAVFEELIAAAGKAKCGEAVRTAARRFLETGVCPVRVVMSPKSGPSIQYDADWPLPLPQYLHPMLRPERRNHLPNRPYFDVLIGMAIAGKRHDEILHWYDTYCAELKKTPCGTRYNGYDEPVAQAVSESHPLRALEIYSKRLKHTLEQTGVSAYETAAGYLRKMKPILKSLDREPDWKQLVAEIQIRYRNRPRLLEILERLEGGRIVSRRRHGR